MRGRIQSLTFGRDGEQYLTLVTKEDARTLFDELHDLDLDIQIKKYHPKRSLDANGYMWVLCEKLARVVGGTKEDVYRQAVRHVGVFEYLPVKQDAVERFKDAWASGGIGWFVEELGESKLDGYIKLMAYYGSSTYNTKEMSRLVDFIVEEAKSQGIETMPPDELAALTSRWSA